MPYLRKGKGNVHLPTVHRELLTTPRIKAGSAVFLDRDGVLVEEVGNISTASQLKLAPRVTEALRSLASSHMLLVVTNQSGIARGYFSEDDLLEVHEELARRFAEEGAAVDAIYYCPHHPEGTEPAYAVECECRKPKPGMLRRAAAEWGVSLATSVMVGDQPSDITAGLTVGVPGIIIGQKTPVVADSALAAETLLDATELIMGNQPSDLKAGAI